MAPPHLFTAVVLLILTPSTSTSTSTSSTLDPKQLTALQSMGLPTARDPCSSNTTAICDSSSPFRHLVALTLSNCSVDLDFSPTALRSLSTLLSLSLSSCPAPQLSRHPLPTPLAASLRSFSALSSLTHLTGVWLSRLKNLTDLDLLSVPIVASGPFVFLSQMPHLVTAKVSDCNLTGKIPHHWHSLNITHLDLSSNRLRGGVPGSIKVLVSLELLNLSSNALDGALPEAIGELIYLKNVSVSRNSISGPVPVSLKELPELAHLDLGSNRFNGSLPGFLAEMKKLRYLNLEDNDFQGVMPFNASFIRRLDVFRVGGNANLCYNHSLISAKMKLGIAPCDKYGMPASPPPDKSSTSGSGSGSGSSDDGDDDSDDAGGGGGRKSDGDHHGPNKLVLGVAIGLSCFVFLVIFLVCISKCCSG